MEKDMGTKSGRIAYIDVAKGLAIIAVVLGHALTNGEDVTKITHPALLNWISFFNVTVFFMINGFLYSEKSVEHPLKSILKKLKAYYLPYVAFNLVFYFFNNLLVRGHFLSEGCRIVGFKAFIKGLISLLLGKMQPLTGPMWFLRALIVMSVLYILIDSLSSRVLGGKFRYAINAVVALLLLLATVFFNVTETFNIMKGCRFLSVYFFGVVYKKFNLNRFIEKMPVVIFAVTLALSAVLANVTAVGLRFDSNYPVAFLAVFISVLMVLSASQLPGINKLEAIKHVGRCSLYIMALHFFAFKFVSLIIMKAYQLDSVVLADIPVIRNVEVSDLWTVAYVLAGVLIPVAINQIKIKVAKSLPHKEP